MMRGKRFEERIREKKKEFYEVLHKRKKWEKRTEVIKGGKKKREIKCKKNSKEVSKF